MFIVLEIQNQPESTAVLVNTYEDGYVAENKYHTILAAAATSSVPIHTAVLMNEVGNVLKSEHYAHRIEEVTEDEGLDN